MAPWEQVPVSRDHNSWRPISGLHLLILLVTMLVVAACTTKHTAGAWVKEIGTTNDWASFPCNNYGIAVCGTDKDYSDAGSLPPSISVGDTVRYTNPKGRLVMFTVRSINFFVYDKDVNMTYAGEKLAAKKGDTTCFVYDVASPGDYASKIVVKGCRLIRE